MENNMESSPPGTDKQAPQHQEEHNPPAPEPEDDDTQIPNNPANALPLPAQQEFDQYGRPMAREKASDLEKFHNPYAVIDHLSGAHCLGFAGATFNKLQYISNNLQVTWAGAYGKSCRMINEQLITPHPNSPRSALRLERQIKWKNLLPTLLLKKLPTHHVIRPHISSPSLDVK
jgi:hypothetical protein